MSSAAQIKANQQNAQLSTGPATPAGLQRSSKNSTVHGFTGKTLLVAPAEWEAYQAHVQEYMDHHKVSCHKHKQLVQQLADIEWSIHQIFVEQTNTIALMSELGAQLREAGADAMSRAAAIAPVARTLNTLNLYETRKRRAAKAIAQELEAFEQALVEAPIPNKTEAKPEIGSVCSVPTREFLLAELDKVCERSAALIRSFEEEDGPELTAQIRRESGF
jgi:hypothetical protein